MTMSVGGVLAEDDCQKTVTLYAGQHIGRNDKPV
ncbi:MAG: hypothetical protein AWU58_1797 [Methanohalophilus sp. T328-1]|jgi:hypothetical protein|nr:MAG: hypothetical protein AWU58_1797 [Methanohalophilus sp. T328-1]